MSQLTTYHEFVLKRDTYLSDVRAMENEVKQSISRITAMKIKVGLELDSQFTSLQFDKLLKRLQQQVNNQPIKIPVMLVQQGGVGGTLEEAIGGGGIAQVGAQQVGARIGGGGRSTSFLGIEGLRPIGTLGAAYFAYRGLQDVAKEVGGGYTFKNFIGMGDELGAMRDPMDQYKAMRAAVESEHSGVRGLANWAYGKAGFQPTYTEEITRLNDAQRADERADTRQREVQAASQIRHGIDEKLTGQESLITDLREGNFAKQRSAIDEAFRKGNEAADQVAAGWQKLHFRTADDAKKLADRMRKDTAELHVLATANIVAQETSSRHQTQNQIEDFRIAERAANLNVANRPREASIMMRQRAAGSVLTRLQEQAEAESDPVKKRQIQSVLNAATPAVEAEQEAIKAEERRRVAESIFHDEMAMSRAWLASRKRDLGEAQRAFDEETEHETSKIEDEDEKQSYIRRRAVEREAMTDRHNRDVARTFAQARDIELQTAGRSGLADEYDIEDETRRNLHEAGNDPAARAAAVALGIAKSRALIKQQARPQVFGSVEAFSQNLQERIFNGDADGLRRASGFLKLLEQNKGRIAGGDKLPGEDDPFASAEQFKQGADKFAGAVDKATGAGNIIGIVRRN